MPQLTEQRQTISQVSEPADFLPIEGVDHIEFYVGNAKQAAYFYRSAFGFWLTAYRGPEGPGHRVAGVRTTHGRPTRVRPKFHSLSTLVHASRPCRYLSTR